MGRTEPRVPKDEAPLARSDLERLLKSVPEEMVLVGGQALSFWMDRYGIGPGEVAQITGDLDLMGTAADAKKLAIQGRGALRLPRATSLTALVAQVRVAGPTPGADFNVDIVHQLFDSGGLRKSAEFTARARKRAVAVEVFPGCRIRILHPMDVLASRVHNAAGLLAEKSGHVLTQVQWAIEVARAIFLTLTAQPQKTLKAGERPGVLAQEVLRLATSAAGRRLFTEHGIDVAAAIPLDEMERALAEFKAQARAVRATLAKSRGK